MRTTTIAQSVLALSALAQAKPVAKRAVVYAVETVTDVQVVTITVDPNQAPTPQAAPHEHADKPHTVVVQEQPAAAPTNVPKEHAASWNFGTDWAPMWSEGDDDGSFDGGFGGDNGGFGGNWPGLGDFTGSDNPAPHLSVMSAPEPTMHHAPEPEAPTHSPAAATSAPPSQPSHSSKPEPKPEPSKSSEPEPTSAAQPAPSSTGANSYQQMVLDAHNIHRANHSANPLEWDSKLEAAALKLAQSCNYGHNTEIDGGGYGQNIGYGNSADHIDRMITDGMYNGEAANFEPYYGEADPGGDFGGYGHFTQIVWKGTTHVGCATYECDHLENASADMRLPYSVCNYGPPGNMAGDYADNVGKPLGKPMVTAN
ncbi:hypothetical protein KEM52_004756 [Ascosphaera acerosa]|nr:hypothetical protein KEM52_004756 [Ascosphaera acerosa]